MLYQLTKNVGFLFFSWTMVTWTENFILCAFWRSLPFLLPWYLFLHWNVHVTDETTFLLLWSGSRLWIYSQHNGEKTSGSRLWGSKDDSWSYQSRIYISGFFESRLLYTHHIFHIVLACATNVTVYAWMCCWKCLLGIVPVPNCSQIHSAWRGDKVNSGTGLSYWPARLHRLGGTLCWNQLHSIVRDFEYGNCIHSRKAVTNGRNNYIWRQHILKCSLFLYVVSFFMYQVVRFSELHLSKIAHA